MEFVVNSADLRQATDQLLANRGKYGDTDFVDIRVSDSVAMFRSLGSESEAPVSAKKPGSVRLPLRVLDKIAKAIAMPKTDEVMFHCEPGVVQIGSFSLKHPEIELDKGSVDTLSLPIDISVLDTLALTKIFPASKIEEEGMRERVEEAHNIRRRAIADAFSALRALEIEEWQVNHFVDFHIDDAAKRLRKTFQI